MDRLFYRMPCLSLSKEFKLDEIHENLFEKQGDKKYLERSIQKFLHLNKRMFDFLGIKANIKGADNNLSLSFQTSNYIGAIPIKMPHDGLVHKDFQVTPKFGNENDVYSELTQLLSCLKHSITPEYSDIDMLCSPMQLKPPTYYEALKYIELFDKACNYSWVKFDTKEQIHPYPKATTDWAKHALTSYDSKNNLIFPSRDSVLTTNHKEWQELKFVFDIAKEQVVCSTVPGAIRYKYMDKIRSLSSKVSQIRSLPTEQLISCSSDPQCIKDVKIQANIILNKSSNSCSAWRMDMAQLFERYVQHIVERGIKELSGTVISNEKIKGSGNIPHWGLRYLEPDMIVRLGSYQYMADAKYKAHLYNTETNSEVLKETHRSDLHQILAYCSFEPQLNKIGFLFYPAQHTTYREVIYSDKNGGICNKVILFGLSFGVKEMEKNKVEIKKFFQTSLLEYQ